MRAPLPGGTPASDFTLPDASGQPVRLADYLGEGKSVVLVFYPLDWSPGCSQQLDLYESERAEFERRGAQLLAVSVDSLYSHEAWAAVRGLGFPCLRTFIPRARSPGGTASTAKRTASPNEHSTSSTARG